MARVFVAAVLVAVAAGCAYVVPTTTKLVDAACAGTVRASDAGRIPDANVRELSGLVASCRHAGVFWTHNDSGDGPRPFAVSKTGRFLVLFVLQGVSVSDWEDIAIGTGPQSNRHYLYVGDIGDNAGRRPQINVLRVPEPRVDPAAPPRANVPLASFENFALRYPDGRDAEALLVDPVTKDVLIVHKNYAGTGEAYVYRIALPRAGAVGTFQRAGTVRLSAGELVTGGEISPTGDAVVLRTYGRVGRLQACLRRVRSRRRSAAEPAPWPAPPNPRARQSHSAPTAGRSTR